MLALPAKRTKNAQHLGSLGFINNSCCSLVIDKTRYTAFSAPSSILNQCASAHFLPHGAVSTFLGKQRPNQNCTLAQKMSKTMTGKYICHFLATIILMLGATQGQAACQIGPNIFKENNTVGSFITLEDIKQWQSGDDITSCDVSNLTDLSRAFESKTAFNQNISAWDTSNVTNMRRMFRNATSFNQPIKSWDTSNVTNMQQMFLNASSFNQDLNHQGTGNWDVSNVTDMRSMFERATVFNGDISDWDVRKATNMQNLFLGSSMNQDIQNWDVSNVTNMSNMFQAAKAFNQNIGGWDVSNVTSMIGMFQEAEAFNQNIGGWDVGEVKNMLNMFKDAKAFNQNIGGWDVSKVNNMQNMFKSANSFRQDIRNWDVSSVANYTAMFSDATAMQIAFNAPHTPQSEWFTPDTLAPTISSVSLNAANTEVTVTFSEAVYPDASASGDLVAADFALSIVGGSASVAATPSSITKTSQTTWVLGLSPSGTANGSEMLIIAPASSTSIYDAAGNAAATSQSNNTASLTEKLAPTVTLSGPSGVVSDDFTVSLTFSEAVTGFTAEDVAVANGTKGAFAGSGASYTLVLTPTLGTEVEVSVPANAATDAAGNGNLASDTFKITAGSPATEFADKQEAIKEDIVREVQQSLQNVVAANARLVREARARFIASREDGKGGLVAFVGQKNVPFDIAGNINADAHGISTQGSFFEQRGTDDGQHRRFFFGDYSINGEHGGSVTASLSGKLVWENQLSDQFMLGYFIGAEVNQTDIQTEFTGTQSGKGFKTGAYFVTEVYKDVFLDGFVSAGLGQSDLDMADDTLALDGSYRPRSLAIGAAMTGVFDRGSYKFWPELAATFAHTTIGDADFTGQAYGVVDKTLSLDAGDVTIATMTARPEVRISLIEEEATARLEQFTFAPRFVCERIVTDSVDESCGGGVDFGFISRSQDGMSNLTWRLSRTYVGNSTRTGLEITIKHSF